MMRKPKGSNSKQNRNAECVVEDHEDELRSVRLHPVLAIEVVEDAPSQHSKVVCASEVDIEQEPNEMSIIKMTDTVIHPGAMVV